MGLVGIDQNRGNEEFCFQGVWVRDLGLGFGPKP